MPDLESSDHGTNVTECAHEILSFESPSHVFPYLQKLLYYLLFRLISIDFLSEFAAEDLFEVHVV